VRGRYPRGAFGAERWIGELYSGRPGTWLVFAVGLIAGDRLIGTVDLDDIDWISRTAETGSWLHRDYRNQGYGTEAKHFLLEYAFDRLGLHVLCSTVWEPNTRSAAALLKQGYRPAGHTRWQGVKDGVYRDLLWCDLTRGEWLAARTAWLASQTDSSS
jgi:RimJ/RimL family protein N-acetyltransferase